MTEASLNPNALIDAEFSRRVYCVNVLPSTTVEDLVNPNFWTHVAMKLRPGDMIEVLSDDKAFCAKLVVRSARRLDATVSLVYWKDLEIADVSQIASEYEIVFRGAKSRWSILKGSDVLKSCFDTRNQAEAYLADHLKAIAA
jgi:TusA-related sulfurtransferase